MTDETKNPEHSPLLDTPSLTVAEVKGHYYSAMEYAVPGQKVNLVDPERMNNNALGAKNGQMAAEIYENGTARIHLIAPSQFSVRHGDLAKTRAVTIEMIIPKDASEDGQELTLTADAHFMTPWIDEQTRRQLRIGQDGLEKIIIFQGEDNQEPLEEAPNEEELNNDFQLIANHLRRSDVKYAIDGAVRDHAESSCRGLGRLLRYLMDPK